MAERSVLSDPNQYHCGDLPNSLKLDDLKLINYDMDTYGATEMRKKLITKWVNDVKMGK
uniref:Uncharacterized protein n=1 Tax=Yersinia enterocolitica W22703 TaxID=913028 RepID=F4N128_YEREN|nr:unknown protein [Yersinia enterocolitica W22703]